MLRDEFARNRPAAAMFLVACYCQFACRIGGKSGVSPRHYLQALQREKEDRLKHATSVSTVALLDSTAIHCPSSNCRPQQLDAGLLHQA